MEEFYNGLHQGDPGTMKTGAAAALLNTGSYRVILASFDGNSAPLLINTLPEHRKNLIVVPFADEFVVDSDGAISKQGASAVRRFNRFLHTGNAEAGKPETWGRDTILIWDELTSAAYSAELLALDINGGVTREGAHINILGHEIQASLALFLSPKLRCHKIMNAHLSLFSPRGEDMYLERNPAQAAKQATNNAIKRERAALEETAFYPNMPGNKVARNIAHSFNTALLFELTPAGKRVIRTQPIKGYTIKCPVAVPDKLPAETGLLTIFKAFGEALK